LGPLLLAEPEGDRDGDEDAERGEHRDLALPVILEVAAQAAHALAHARRGDVLALGDRLELLALALTQHPVERLLRVLAGRQVLLRPAKQVGLLVRRRRTGDLGEIEALAPAAPMKVDDLVLRDAEQPA